MTPKKKLSEIFRGRQSQVIALFLTGLASKEIADRLNITPKTVETHKDRIMQKTGVRPFLALCAQLEKFDAETYIFKYGSPDDK
jgi:DNA-binding NarL/FixJ family response regulator